MKRGETASGLAIDVDSSPIGHVTDGRVARYYYNNNVCVCRSRKLPFGFQPPSLLHFYAAFFPRTFLLTITGRRRRLLPSRSDDRNVSPDGVTISAN